MEKENKTIIGLLGETGSGKDTVCKIIENNFKKAGCFRFSETLTDALGLFLDEIKKEDQQWLASVLRDRFGEDIVARALAKKIKNSNKEVIVLNGMRVEEDFDFVKKLGGKVVYIKLDIKKRWERVKKREEKDDDNISYEKFVEIDKGRTEKQIRKLGEKADLVIENSGDVKELEKKVVKMIKKI